jgi:hypothetical protein
VSDWVQLVDQIPDLGIGFLSDESRQTNADLRAVVPSQDGAILNEGNSAAVSGGTDGRTNPRHPSAYDYEVIVALVPHFLLVREESVSQGLDLLKGIAGSEIKIVAQQNDVAAPIESGEILQRKNMLTTTEFDDSTILPVPIGALFAKERFERPVVDHKMKTTGRTRRFHGALECIALPFPDPVTGANPYPVFSSIGDPNLDSGILDFLAKAMSHEIGGPHLVH